MAEPNASPQTDNDFSALMFGGKSPEQPLTTPKLSTPAASDDLSSLMFGVSASKQTPKSEPTDFSSLMFGGANQSAFNESPQQSVPQIGREAGSPNDPWYKRAWDWANTPLVDEQQFERWTGREGQAGGFEKGAYDVASGMTTPLSLLLLLGGPVSSLFGGSVLAESGGAALLKAAGMGAEDVAAVSKGAQIAAKAYRTGGNVTQELTAAGINPETVMKGLQTLKQYGMDTEALRSSALVHKTASSLLRSIGGWETPAGIAKAENVGRGVQALLDAGFSIQNAYGAVIASPRVLDALKEGDYDTAKRLAVNALAGGAFGYLGARATFKEAGSLMEDYAVKAGLKVKPSDENLKLMNAFGQHDRDVTSSSQAQQLWADDLRKRYPDVKEPDLHRMLKWIESGEDEATMAQRYNWLAEAAGSGKRISTPGSGNETPFVNIQKMATGTSVPPDQFVGATYPLSHDGDYVLQRHTDDYNRLIGRRPLDREVVGADPRAGEIADAYDELKHNPQDPAVKASYEALIRDVKHQWKYLQNLGHTMDVSDEDPYSGTVSESGSPNAMVEDVRKNKHITVWSGGQPPADHPLSAIDPETGVTYNTLFRAVHDIMGHSPEGFDFSEKGEENAWNQHRQMFSKEALPALTTETKGQASWYYNNRAVREGSPTGKFPEQKAALLPEKFWHLPGEKEPMAPKAIVQHITSGRNFAILQAENPQNQRVSEEINAQRNAALKADLEKMGYRPVPVQGFTQDVAGYTEHAFFVPGIAPEDAAALGRKYQQAGILTREGLHWLEPNPDNDYVIPSRNGDLIVGEAARRHGYHTVIKGANGEEIPFHVPLDETRRISPYGVQTYSASRVGPPPGSTVGLLDRPLRIEPNDQGNITAEQIGEALQKFTTGRSRLAPLEVASVAPEKMVERAVKLGKAELARQLAEENSGRNWYSTDIQVMHEELAKLHPELAGNKKLQGFVTGLGSAASLGNDSASTIKLIDEIYSEYKRTGKIPTTRPNGEDWGSAHSNANRFVLENLRRIVDHVGGDVEQAYAWMMKKHPVSELREVKQGRGKLAGKADDQRYGAYALSPKAGAFFLNMNGIEGELTMDKWATRTWNRWMGTLIEPDGSVRESPRSEGERKIATQAFDELRKQFGLSVREAQAVMWYYEQRLWQTHGLDIEQGVSYGSAAQEYVRRKLSAGGAGSAGDEVEAGRSNAGNGRVRPGSGPGAGQIPPGADQGTQFRPGIDFARTETGKIKMGADPAALGKILGSSLYAGKSAKVITKELVQNALDAVRLSPDAKNVHVDLDEKDRVITVTDSGPGMTRHELETVFTDLGASGKRESTDASGGFGIAKAAPLMMSKKLAVRSVVNEGGQKIQHMFISTPEQMLGEGVEVHSQPVPPETPTGLEIKSFITDDLWDAKNYLRQSQMSLNPPGKLTYTVNGAKPYGADAPLDVKPVAKTAIPGAELSLYSSNERNPWGRAFGIVSVEVHNNGIFQFTTTVRSHGLQGVPTRVAIDVHSLVAEGDPKYPFLANRESLRNDTSEEIHKFVTDQIIRPAAQAEKDKISELYHSLPTFPGTKMPIFDSGNRLKPEELAFFQSHPVVRQLADTIHELTEHAIRRASLNEALPKEFGKAVKRIGLVFSDKIHGVFISDPKNEGHATVFINPFQGLPKDPYAAASLIWHTIKHEITHDVAKGHNENFTTTEKNVSASMGQLELQALRKLTEIYGTDKDNFRGIRPELDRALQIYGESRARPETAPDIFGGEASRAGGKHGSGEQGDDAEGVRDSGTRTVRGTDDERIKELVAAKHLKAAYSPQQIESLLDSYDYRKLSPQHRQMAKEAKGHFDESLEFAQQHGVLDQGVENYASHYWEKDENNPAANRLIHEARNGGFSVNTSMARARIFQSAFEGELLGKKLKFKDPIALAAHNRHEFERVVAARKVLEQLRDSGLRASDGRPMVALSGTGHVADANGENPAIFVNPNSIRSIRIADKVVKGLERSGDLEKLENEGKIRKIGTDEDGKPVYAWDPHDYRTVAHPAFRDWNYAAQYDKGKPVLVKGELRVHPEAFDYLNKRLGKEVSPLESSGVGRTLLGAGREAKGVLLFGSPFHIAQEGLRALMTGISPFGVEKWDLRTDEKLARGVEAGLTLGTERHGPAAFEEGRMMGHSKVLQKIPGLSQTQTWLQSFLFDKYIPGLKARGYKHLYDRYREAYPEWSEKKVTETAAADTNERFGGINYRRMGRSVATQDLFRLVALAPDWLESELRFMARTFGDEGKIARRDVARMAVGMWAAMRVLNYLVSGQPHNEAPFGVAVKDKSGKEKVYSVRTLPTDMLHAISDPGNFLAGRASPLVRAGTEAYTGRDEYGRKVPSHNLAVDIFRNSAPIPVQTAVKTMTGEMPEVGNADQAVKAAGATVFPYRTEAQKLAAKLASDHSETGPVDPMLMRRHQLKIKFEEDLRSGQMKPQDLFELVDHGEMPAQEARQIMKSVQETHGMDPQIASLWIRASRLPAPDFLRVWDSATNNEKAALSQLLIRKRVAYFKKAVKDMTPQERLADPTYRRLRALFPQEAPW